MKRLHFVPLITLVCMLGGVIDNFPAHKKALAQETNEVMASNTAALVLVDNRLYTLLKSEIDLYIELAEQRRGFNIFVDSDKNLDDYSYIDIRSLIKSYYYSYPELEGVLFIGNIKLPSFYKCRADELSIKLFAAYYEDLHMNVSRHYGPGAVDPYCDGNNSPYCQVVLPGGYSVPEHDYDDIVIEGPPDLSGKKFVHSIKSTSGIMPEPDIWTCYMPVGNSNTSSYNDFANQLRPFLTKVISFYQGSYKPNKKMYMVSNDLGEFNFWELYDDVSNVDFYSMNPSQDTTCICSGRTPEQCYTRVPLENYASYDAFLNDYNSRFWMGEDWQTPDIYTQHMTDNNYEFVVVNVHSNDSTSIIEYQDANVLQHGGMIMMGLGCSVAGFKQPQSPSNVESVWPAKNILVNYLTGDSHFLAALGDPFNRCHYPYFEKMIYYMKKENDYLGKAHYKRMQHLYANASGTLALKDEVQEMLLGDPFLDVVQDSPPIHADRSPYPLHMPFSPGTTWQVGGVGNFYGEGGHTDTNNDYYATDWNRVGGEGLNQTVFPVAPGKVVETGSDQFYGQYIDIVHSFEEQPRYGVIKTRYAHLNGINVATGDIVYINTPIGKVGNTGNSTGPHLHLSFRIFNGTNFISLSNADLSRTPCPMVAYSNGTYQLWEFKDGESRTAAAKQFFSDVPNGFWAKPWVDAVHAWGVMEAYPPEQKSLFNPDVPVTRAYIAQFWVKAYHGPDYTPPRATGTIFNDVPADYWAAPWIEQLYRDGFTKGCSEDPPLYCPEDDVKRAEVAVFILRALHGSDYYPPEPTGHVFDDAPYDYWGTKWVEQLAKEGITSGCSLNPPLFCPENPVTRAEMSVFLLRAFGIYPPVIGGHGGAPEEPRTWEAQLVVKDAGNGQGTLVFGKSVTATEALDAAFNESELPPLPPSGSFDARFELPSMSGVGTLRDFRPTQQNETTWKIKFQPGLDGYPITLSWTKAELPSGVFILKDEITGSIISVDMKTQETLTVTNPGITSLLIQENSLFVRNVDVFAGWNLLSVPTVADNMRVTSLFPNAGSEAYCFDNGYIIANELSAGVGYWLKFAQPYKFSVSGEKVLDRTLSVKQGWNMIGPFETDVFITDILTTPANIVQTSYYGFENGYLPVSILRVGKGYWVKANQAGVLTLPEGAGFSKGLVASTLIDKLHSWPRITITDTNDGQAALYLMPRDTKINKASFELPPVPPQGLFDLRFAGDHFVERLDKAVFALKLSGEHYPLTVIAQNLGDLELELQAQQGAWSENLFEGQEVILEHRMDQLSLVANATNSLPAHYELSQNYPNPFNPKTTIKFSVPEATHVTMTLYNALGAKVAELLDSTMSAGYHELDVDARHYASGIYFYTLETPAFKDIKKMVVLK
ncbi:peptidoglycan DD-metalloendopeptidase family protein [candidate division KSB1 bacterium]|nr:peptidoglycan DD-metalloendopeptidase family protein [candidate division KSB1 bacterium]